MKITPIDVQQQSFSKKFNGIDPQEVASYLELVAAELEDIIAENKKLKNDLALKESELNIFKEREAAIKETMVAAQKANEELRSQAKREADIMLSDAELKAEKIIQNAHSRMLAITEELGELKRQKIQFQESLRSLVNAHSKLLDLNDELSEADNLQENKVAYLQSHKVTRFDIVADNNDLPIMPAIASVG